MPQEPDKISWTFCVMTSDHFIQQYRHIRRISGWDGQIFRYPEFQKFPEMLHRWRTWLCSSFTMLSGQNIFSLISHFLISMFLMLIGLVCPVMCWQSNDSDQCIIFKMNDHTIMIITFNRLTVKFTSQNHVNAKIAVWKTENRSQLVTICQKDLKS